MKPLGRLQKLVVKALTDNTGDWLDMLNLVDLTGAYNQSIRRAIKGLVEKGIVEDKQAKKEPANGIGLPKMYKLYKIV